MNPLILATALISAVESRDMEAESMFDASHQRQHDATISQYLASLADFPASRWLALSEGIGPSPLMIAAASHCQGFAWESVQESIHRENWLATPCGGVARAAGLCRGDLLPRTPRDISWLQFMHGRLAISVRNFRLSAMDFCPRLDPDITGKTPFPLLPAQTLAWFWARDGFGAMARSLLLEWNSVDQESTALRFWASLALLLRSPQWHDRVFVLDSLHDDDPTRLAVLGALKQAIADGPLTPESANREFHQLNEGSRARRLARAFRLAAFVPGTAPVVDPHAPTARQDRLASRLGQVLAEAIRSNVDFMPAAYIAREQARREEERRNNAQLKKIADNMITREWTQAKIDAALAGEGMPVTGHAGGRALCYRHPDTYQPVVIDAASREVLHLGRPDYRYRRVREGSDQTPMPRNPDPWARFVPDDKPLLIHIPLRNEGIDVWRPVRAYQWTEERFCVIIENRYVGDPLLDERWEFRDHVICVNQEFAEGTVPVAIRRFDPEAWRR